MDSTSLFRSDVSLDYVWDDHASNLMHVLTVAETPKDIETLVFRGFPPELACVENDPSAIRVPALQDAKTGSYVLSGSDTIAEDHSYISAPSPDGKAVLIDFYLDQVLVLDQFGRKYAKWALPGGTLMKLISATSDTDSLWLLYWENIDDNGNNTFRFERRNLIDGSLVEYEATDGISSEVMFDREWNAVLGGSDLDEWYAVLGDSFIDIREAIESLAALSEILTNTFNADCVLDNSTYTFESDSVLEVITEFSFISSETSMEATEEEEEPYVFTHMESTTLLADLSRNFVWSVPECPGTPGSSDCLLADCEVEGVEVHAWVTMVDRSWYCHTTAYVWWHIGEPDQLLYGNFPPTMMDFDLMDVHHEWTVFSSEGFWPYDYFYLYPYSSIRSTSGTGEGAYSNDPKGSYASKYMPGLDKHIQYGDEQWYDPEVTGSFQGTSRYKNKRPISSPVIQASESNLYVINTFSRKWLNLRDLTKDEGDPDRRTTKSIVYRYDKESVHPIKSVKPQIVSMSCAYGRAATDKLGLILVDTFTPAEYSLPYTNYCRADFPIGVNSTEWRDPEDKFFKEGDMLIFDENLTLVYDEPKALPLALYSLINSKHVFNMGEHAQTYPDYSYYEGQTRQFSTVLAYGEYIITVYSEEGHKPGVTSRFRFRVYNAAKESYEILVGKQGSLLGYSVRPFYNYVASDMDLFADDSWYFACADIELAASSSSMIHSEVCIQIDEAVGAYADIFIDIAIGAEVQLGNLGYREQDYIISNTSPVTTLNREVLTRFGGYTYVWPIDEIPIKEDQPFWAYALRELLASNMLTKDYTTPIPQDTDVGSIALPCINDRDNHATGCYPASTHIWIRQPSDYRYLGEPLKEVSGARWYVKEESALWEAQAFGTRDSTYEDGERVNSVWNVIPLPVQYAVDPDYGIFGFFRPADGELSKDVRDCQTFLDSSDSAVQEGFPGIEEYTEPYEMLYVSVTGQWYTMGCRLYKFEGIDTLPYSMYELQDQYTDSSGTTHYFTYRHFGIDSNKKEIFVVRCKGKHNIFSIPNRYDDTYDIYDDPLPYYKRLQFQKYISIPTWDEFYDWTFAHTLYPKDLIYWPIESIEFEDNSYTDRDILVLDYDFGIKYAIGPASIDGLQDDDVIQHVVGKDGYVFIFTQVKEAAGNWEDLFEDWFNSDEELLKRYGHMESFVTYRKARMYAVRGSLKTGTAKLLHEFNYGTFGQDNIVIQEVTDTHVWLNWDGIRPFMRGPLSGIGIRLDGTGIDEVPGLVAVVENVYAEGWQLITYPRTVEFPDTNNAESKYYDPGTVSRVTLSSEYYDRTDERQSNVFWGEAQNVLDLENIGGYTAKDRSAYASYLNILNENTLDIIDIDKSVCVNGPYDIWDNIYVMNPACHPAVSTFVKLRVYDWVSSDVTLKGESLLNTPTTWIVANNGTNGVVLL